jgi:hypothetical protein
LLPVPYFHVIQTLPHDPHLDRLVLTNRKLLFGLLFRATAESLLELAADPQHLGARIGLLMVLHTWGQLMQSHVHVHVVVPGGGLSLDGSYWVSCPRAREFFLPVHVIGALFRGKFLAGLKQLWRDGNLKLEGKLSHLADERAFESWLSPLYKKKWVVYSQGPPSGIEGAEAVLKYLARYVSGVAISDKRLVSHADGRVSFRWKNYRRGRHQETTSLPGVEFVARYMQHVLPRGLVRIRYYGLLSNRHRQKQVTRCRTLIEASTSPAPLDPVTRSEPEALEVNRSERREPPLCPSCGRGRLVLTETWPRVTGWPWQSGVPVSIVAEPPMHSTFEGFLARRRSQPSTSDTREGISEDTS